MGEQREKWVIDAGPGLLHAGPEICTVSIFNANYQG